MARCYIPASLRDVQTLPELFAWRVAASPRGTAYRWFDGATAQWLSPVSYTHLTLPTNREV